LQGASRAKLEADDEDDAAAAATPPEPPAADQQAVAEETPVESPEPPPVETRNGVVDSVKSAEADGKNQMVIVDGFFTPEEDISKYVGNAVTTEAGETGEVKAGFGKKGKCKVIFADGTSAVAGDKCSTAL
jgi:hypothetical protein